MNFNPSFSEFFYICTTKRFSMKFQLFGSPFWIGFELRPDAGIWRMWVEARRVLRPGESGAGAVAGFIFLCSRGRANPIAILKACLPQKTFPVSHFPAGRQRVAGERDAAGGNSPSTSTSTFCGFAVAAKLAANAKKPSQEPEPERKPVAGTKWRATRSRTPMPQDFTMCDASRIWCTIFFFFLSFFPFWLVVLPGLVFCLFYFLGTSTKNVNLPQKKKVHIQTPTKWLSVNLYITYTACRGIFSFRFCTHIMTYSFLGRVCTNWPRVSS